jgi:cobalt-zinc-cadmium efflux system outer membrane protein
MTCLSSGCLSTGQSRHFRDSHSCGPISTTSLPQGQPVVPGNLPSGGAAKQTPESKSKVSLASFTPTDAENNADIAQAKILPAASMPLTRQADAVVRSDVGIPNAEQLVGQSPDQPLTLVQVENLAIANNPDLRKARAEIESLKGKYIQAGLRPNPQFGYSSSDVGEEGTAGQQGAFFSQEFIRGGKLQLNRSIVCQEIEAAKQQLEINRQKLMTEVRQRFYDLLVAQERIIVVQKFSQLSRDAASISDKLFQAQEISKLASLRAEIQAKNITIVLAQAENDLAAATRRLAAATGIGQPDSIDAGSLVVAGVVVPELSIIDPQRSYNDLIAGSPELAQAAAELERAKWNLNRQVVEPTRNIQIQTTLTHGNVSSDDLVAVQVGVPLRINDRNQGNIAAARSEIAAGIENIASIQRDLAQRFSVAWRDHENARLQIEKFQNEIIPASAEFYELVESAFKAGEQDYLDLVSAQQTYLTASLQNLDALQQYWRASALIDGYLLSEN